MEGDKSTGTKEKERMRKGWQPDEHKNERVKERQSGIERNWREGRRRELVWGSNWSQRSFDRRWKKQVMRSEMVQMNRRGRWMQTRTGGDEIKERRGEEKKNSEGRLKYLWCHLCWRMTPPLCNNMNGDSVGCLASQNFACTWCGFVFPGVWALLEA